MRNSVDAPKRKHRNPLGSLTVKQQLFLLFLVLGVPLFVLFSYGSWKTENVLKRHVTNAYIELNKQNFIIINRDTESINKITSTVIQNPLLQQIDMSGKDGILSRLSTYIKLENTLAGYSQAANGREPNYYSLYIYDPNNYYSFAPNYPEVRKAGVYFFTEDEKPDWYDEAVAKKGNGYLRILDQLSPFSPKEQTLGYVRAINNISQGGTIGVLVVTRMNDKFNEAFRNVSLPEGNIYLTDWDNRVLASTTDETNTLLDLPQEVSPPSKGEGVVDVITSDFIYVVNYNHYLGQKLVYQIPTKSLLQQQKEIKHVMQLISLVYAFAVFVLITYFWRALMTPLQKLAFFVRRYEPGGPVPRLPDHGQDNEVGILIRSTYEMASRLNGMVRNQYEMEIKQREAQLQILYQQINPHLLYNTLESIYWKSELEGSHESAEMIKELSKLMKISLSRGRELITLEEELEHARAYVKLQEHRYEYGCRVSWQLDNQPDVRGTLIPKVTLQPLIENAMIHGVKHMGEDGEIVVSTYEREDRVVIRIEDNGYKKVDFEALEKLLYDENPDHSLGYGIRNVQQRIRLHFGQPFGLSYRPREGGGTVVEMLLPKHSSQAEGEDQDV
ncbi:histidine kinase [Paenibacillus yonginensis]|uniref:Histidine kinase n=1 Tax=Paenibacillus yonginensis TaxID=1462996 RepID=A0A1B1N6B3_9BACL|nr:sensor histidine kinase [Paenibacillus yonginensis]ANS76952.1 histidine kinase [Paenibacillus yonginensis]